MIIALLLNRFFPTWILSLAGTTILTLAIGFIFIKLQIIMKSRELIAGEGKAVVITGKLFLKAFLLCYFPLLNHYCANISY